MYADERSHAKILLVGAAVMRLVGGDYRAFMDAMEVFDVAPVDCYYIMEDIQTANDQDVQQ